MINCTIIIATSIRQPFLRSKSGGGDNKRKKKVVVINLSW